MGRLRVCQPFAPCGFETASFRECGAQREGRCASLRALTPSVCRRKRQSRDETITAFKPRKAVSLTAALLLAAQVRESLPPWGACIRRARA